MLVGYIRNFIILNQNKREKKPFIMCQWRVAETLHGKLHLKLERETICNSNGHVQKHDK